MLGVIFGVPPLPSPGNSHFLESILEGDNPQGPPGSPPGLLVEKDDKTFRKLLIAFINKPIG